MAKYLKINKNYQTNDLLEASNSIKEGNLVIFPTETVYGIGADGFNEDAIKKIYEAKGRKQDNPLIYHISDKDMLNKIAKDISKTEMKLIDNFFNGPFTIILNKKENVPDIATGGLKTVAVRMPSNKIALDLISLANTPIAAPSANISGRPSGTNIEDIYEELNDKVDYIIDGGNSKIGLESTVVRVIENKVHILRPGAITKEDIEKLNLEVVIDKHILKEITNNEDILSPGMKYKHYAPNTKCLLIFSKDNFKFINEVKKIEQEKNILVLCKTSNTKHFKNAIPLGNNDLEISKNLFTTLRKVDQYNVDLVVIEGVINENLGLAIMNRLIKACSYNYIEI